MICPICRQAELVDGLTSIPLESDEVMVVINHVPARVCSGCGEAYVKEQVAEALLLQAHKISATGVMESVIDYNTLS